MPFVSHKLKIAFVHVPKTAGSSIIAAIRSVDLDAAYEGYKHAHFKPGTYEGFWRFAVVRHPADRLYSFYRSLKGWPWEKIEEGEPWREVKLARTLPFEQWLDYIRPSSRTWAPQARFVDGVDNVLRYENLDIEWLKVLEQFPFPVELPRFHVSQVPPERMTRAARQRVFTIYREDYAAFGYE